MAQTVIPWGDPKAQKKWSANLAVDTVKKSYFEQRFIGTSDNSIIQRKTELESGPGDRVSFDLAVQLRGQPTFGDARLEGREENQKFYTDEVAIDQVRHAVSAGGRMTRKRTAHDLRATGKARLADYFAKLHDELIFMYLSGARGINQDYTLPASFTGFAGNAFQAPDSDHHMFGGDATSLATLTADDKMTRNLIERAKVKADMMQAQNPDTANMVPVGVGAESHYVMLMSEFQAYDLRQEVGQGGWLDIQKAAAAAEGRKNPIFIGGLGMINGVVLHSHRNVIRLLGGADGTVPVSRALFLGRQAAAIAYGSKGGLRYDWKEELKDYDNEPTVASGFIGGIKKTRFNGRDFGVITIDTAASDPNAPA